MPTDAALTERLAHVIMRAGGPSAVARLLNVTPPAVGAWTRGSVPYNHHLVQLAEKLGISLRWLQFGEGEEEAADRDGESTSTRDGHGPRGARLREDVKPRNTPDLARALAQKIIDFETTPASFEKLALAEIQNDYEEFMHRAKRRIEIHSTKPAKYQPGNNHKRKP